MELEDGEAADSVGLAATLDTDDISISETLGLANASEVELASREDDWETSIGREVTTGSAKLEVLELAVTVGRPGTSSTELDDSACGILTEEDITSDGHC
jgi:hypothetical protein